MNPRISIKIAGLFILLLAIGAPLISSRLVPINPQATFDEHAYVWLGQQLHTGGMKFLEGYTRDFLVNDDIMKLHSPSRILLPLWLSVVLKPDVEPDQSRWAMLPIQMAWLALAGWICLQELGPRKGLLASLLVASSPFWLGTGSRIWSDALFGLEITLVFWGCLQWHRHSSRAWLTLACTAMVLAAFTKETLLLYLAGGLCFLSIFTYRHWKSPHPDFRKIRGLWICLLLGGFTLVGWLQWLYGDLFVYLHRMAQISEGNTWSKSFSGGPWFRYAVDQILMSPVVFIASLGILLQMNPAPFPSPWRFWFWSIWILFSILPFKELRYLGHLDIPIAMAATLQIAAWAQSCGKRALLSLVFILSSFIHAHILFAEGRIWLGTTYELYQTLWAAPKK